MLELRLIPLARDFDYYESVSEPATGIGVRMNDEKMSEVDHIPSERDETKFGFDADDSRSVTLKSGEQITLIELKAGYLRQKDYAQKLQTLSEHRQRLERSVHEQHQYAKVLRGRYLRLTEFLNSLIPEQPSPELSSTDPDEYSRQVELRNQAQQELNAIMTEVEENNRHDGAMRERQAEQYRCREAAQMLENFPQLRDENKRMQFMRELVRVARLFGFSDKELAETQDHRVLTMLHYAGIGHKDSDDRQDKN